MKRNYKNTGMRGPVFVGGVLSIAIALVSVGAGTASADTSDAKAQEDVVQPSVAPKQLQVELPGADTVANGPTSLAHAFPAGHDRLGMAADDVKVAHGNLCLTLVQPDDEENAPEGTMKVLTTTVLDDPTLCAGLE